MKNIIDNIQDRYYTFVPSKEFIPVYDNLTGRGLVNKKDFHKYKIKHWRETCYFMVNRCG